MIYVFRIFYIYGGSKLKWLKEFHTSYKSKKVVFSCQKVTFWRKINATAWKENNFLGFIVKKRFKKKKKICKTCAIDIIENENRDTLKYSDTYHQLSAKEYCKEHEISHSDHKCKPSWCGDCGFLIQYDIMIDWEKKARLW